ncbi:MAG: AraC family transcriptional regulator, partial [Eubacterium sp.]|nr:AraC family transcriptional regulator [Eubacterium sp.]
NYSKNQIIRIFKETYGITPYRYFIERKIDIAKLYLSNTKSSISEISKILSFSDQNYFSSEFKKTTSLSPSDYRKKMN